MERWRLPPSRLACCLPFRPSLSLLFGVTDVAPVHRRLSSCPSSTPSFSTASASRSRRCLLGRCTPVSRATRQSALLRCRSSLASHRSSCPAGSAAVRPPGDREDAPRACRGAPHGVHFHPRVGALPTCLSLHKPPARPASVLPRRSFLRKQRAPASARPPSRCRTD